MNNGPNQKRDENRPDEKDLLESQWIAMNSKAIKGEKDEKNSMLKGEMEKYLL